MSYNSISPSLIKCITEEFADRKFSDGDALYDFATDAVHYVQENTPGNSFIEAMSKSYLRYGSFTKGQLRGILNCIRAEVLSADRQAQQTIDQITTGKEPLDLRTIPSGSYAVDHGGGEVAFYVIDNIKEEKSKWSGWVFASILASDTKIRVGSQRPNQTYQGKHQELLEVIKNDPYKAATLFGHLIGRCGICGKVLTDEKSRELGIGPICYEKVFGASKSEILRALTPRK